MISEKMLALGKKSSAIRAIFEYGKKRKAEIGEENVFDFSLGNPSVCPPPVVNETIKKLIEEAGRLNVPGRPIQYATTPDFLRTFGLSSLDELPEIERVNFGETIAEEAEQKEGA